MKFTERELTIIKCALSDYQFQFVNDTSNQDLLEEIVEIINKKLEPLPHCAYSGLTSPEAYE